ncbi:CAMK/CAMK1 protein kinase [Obelidium mucronatum]|nr:CAMK/CAMK1 protein kinase [Obelidium mucronatum]
MSLAPCEYKTGKTLGQGSYATVKEAVISTGEHFAVKVISKKLMAGREHLILNEIEILKKVSKGNSHIVTLHDCIVPGYGLYVNSYLNQSELLFLWNLVCTGGELFDRIVERGSFFEEDAAEIIRTVLEAVAYLHSQNIVHRDLKPENLLFRAKDSNDLVIADFGLSKISDGEALNNLRTLCGTPGYMAPEVILKTGHGKSVDLWSIGVMTYFLLCGYTPFDGGNRDDIEKVLAGNYAFEPSEYWVDISDKAQDFIKRTILPAEALNHPWILEYAPGAFETPVNRVPTKDLLPDVKRRVTAGKTKFRAAVDTVLVSKRLSHASLKASATGFGTTPMEVDEGGLHPKDEKDLMVLTRS